MKITNTLGLPAPLVRAVTPEPRPRVANRISLTTLTMPPQIVALSRLHDEELVEDASDRIFALLGTLLHDKLEGHCDPEAGEIAEEKLTIEVNGYTVVGKYDLSETSEIVIDREVLTDYKLTSVWAVKEGLKPDWTAQLNCYIYLIEQVAGRKISQAQIVAIGRDWSKLKARFDKDYPQQQVKVIPVPLWVPEETRKFIEERVRLHQEAEKGIWPDCTPEERWARPTQYAVMKKGQKRAVRLFETRHAAEFAVAKEQYIVERPGESVRCSNYCSVSGYCKQFAALKAAQ